MGLAQPGLPALGREVLGQDLSLQANSGFFAPEGLATQIAPEPFAGSCRLHPEVRTGVPTAGAPGAFRRIEADEI